MIYHYTSIKGLAAILSSKKIRFTRLDCVDDPDEYGFVRNDINPAQYVFVSCWSRSKEEVIPQWRLYGDNEHGVRIGMQEEMFYVEKLNKRQYRIAVDKETSQNLSISPMSDNLNVLDDIKYVDDVKSKSDKVFKYWNDKKFRPSFQHLGVYKQKCWQFQKECRFKLVTYPLIDGLMHNKMLDNKVIPNSTFIDVPLKKDVFSDIEITMGPSVTPEEEIIIKAVVGRYVNNASVKKSNISK